MRLEDARPGALVEYRRFPEAYREVGLVTEVRGEYVFVRYEHSQAAKATDPNLLTLLAVPVPGPRRQVLERLADLHREQIRWLPYPDAAFSFESEQDAREYGEDGGEAAEDIDAELTTFSVCAECARVEGGANGDATVGVGYETSLWPCATAVLLREAGVFG